ncbi:MAG: OmpA family protein [Bacteroidia bacterium]
MQLKLTAFFLLIQTTICFSQNNTDGTRYKKPEATKIVFWKTYWVANGGLTGIDSIDDKTRNSLFHQPLTYGRPIYFITRNYYNSFKIRVYALDYLNESKGALDSIVDYLKTNNTKNISITGHVTAGKDALEKKYEQRSSEALAEIVKEYLVQHQIDPKRIKISGAGSTGLLYENEHDKILNDITTTNRNNRVEIKVLP